MQYKRNYSDSGKKGKYIFLFLLFFVLGKSETVSAQKKEKWKLVWKDEFNYTGVPKASKWGYELGHIRNSEQQYYTARKENVWVNNGVLTITGRKENYPNEFFKKGVTDWKVSDSLGQYTSASINTLGKAVPIAIGRQYGRVEVKAKLPHGGGIWPAIWMMGANRPEVGWPKCGEIDIMEFVGNHPEDIYGTIHYPVDEGNKSSGGKTPAVQVNSDFHIYAMEWNEKMIDLYFDKIKYHSFPIDTAGTGSENPFRKPFYLLINLAMGANWPGPIDDKVLPQQFIIDYVRVYQK